MSNHLKSLLAIAALGLAANTAMAQDGNINFTGKLLPMTCTVVAGTGLDGNGDLNVDLGGVPVTEVNTSSAVALHDIQLSVQCTGTTTGLSNIRMTLDASQGSGHDGFNDELLKIIGYGTGTNAKGVGIAVFNGTSGAQLNMQQQAVVNAPFVVAPGTGSGVVLLKAGYLGNGDPASVSAGDANATLPFSLTYN